MNALSVRDELDESNDTLVMPNRPMPYPASGVVPVSREAPASAEMAAAQPASAVLSIAPVSMPAGAEPAASVATRPSTVPDPAADPPQSRARVALIIALGFFVGVGGSYGYQVATHSLLPHATEAQPVVTASAPAAAAAEAPPAPAAEPEPPPAAEATPAEATPHAEAAPPAANETPAPVAKAASEQPRPVKRATPRRPRRVAEPAASAEPSLEGRDLLSEGLAD